MDGAAERVHAQSHVNVGTPKQVCTCTHTHIQTLFITTQAIFKVTNMFMCLCDYLKNSITIPVQGGPCLPMTGGIGSTPPPFPQPPLVTLRRLSRREWMDGIQNPHWMLPSYNVSIPVNSLASTLTSLKGGAAQVWCQSGSVGKFDQILAQGTLQQVRLNGSSHSK